ncbi:MAG: MFS transporter [Chromatiales bacterium]|nr:MFS transporter [Chromatiales bacterium]
MPLAGRFALAAALFSNAGQTFFIGLFGTEFRTAFELSEVMLGAWFGAVTLTSGLLMFWLGAIADWLPLRRAVALALSVLGCGALLLGVAQETPMLLAGLFLVRLGGQGLTGHLAVVAAARYTLHRRGRAVAMATYGNIIGEAMFPPLVALALGHTGWQTVWLFAAGLIFAMGIPLLRALAQPLSGPGPQLSAPAERAGAGRLTRADLFRSPVFPRVLSITLVPPCVITAIFLHQGTLAGLLGWTMTAVASGFVVYAGCSALFAFGGGRLVDLFGARALLRFSLVPAGIGILGLSLLHPAVSLWLLFAGLGMSAGLNAIIGGAIWAELYGSAQLGMIRGVTISLMVLSTAIGPPVLGLLFARDVSLLAMGAGYMTWALLVPMLVMPGINARKA